MACAAKVHAPSHDPLVRLPPHSTCHLLLRVSGGKGGFGSLLRAAGQSGSATTNQDAMRDLSGRRMRHVEAEKKMKAHAREAPQRALELAAMKHIKGKGSDTKRKFREIEEREKERYTNESMATVKGVTSAIAIGVAAERKEAQKMKKESLETKRGEDERTQRLNSGYMGFGGLGGVSDDSDDDSDSDEDEKSKALAAKKAKGKGGKGGKGNGAGTGKGKGSDAPSTPPVDVAEVNEIVTEEHDTALPSTASEPVPSTVCVSTKDKELSSIDLIDLSAYDCASDLEILGLAVLKDNLSAKGLKCGGTLSQRAERLWVLKDCELGDVQEKHKAKAKR